MLHLLNRVVRAGTARLSTYLLSREARRREAARLLPSYSHRLFR